MNTLSNTKVFTYVDKVFGVSKLMSDSSFDIGKYIIPSNAYVPMVALFKGYKYILAKPIIESIRNGVNIPVLLSEPVDPNHKAMILPTTISSFIKKYNGKIIAFTDVSDKGKYIRDIKGDPELLKISEIVFYNYCQLGFINKTFFDRSTAIELNNKITKTISEAYAILLSKCISSTYPIASDPDSFEILMYICACFAYQNFFGFETDKAKASALTFRRVNKSNIMNNCRYFKISSDKIDMAYNSPIKYGKVDGKDVQIYPIDILLSILINEFPMIKSGKIEYQNLIAKYTSMYGGKSLLAIEHCFSFVAMIKSACLKAGLYTDLMIENMTSVYVDDFDKALMTIL